MRAGEGPAAGAAVLLVLSGGADMDEPQDPKHNAVKQAPKHRWYQFHLSTAIVLMFVAGLLMWKNSIEDTVGYEVGGQSVRGYGYGWPWPIQCSRAESRPSWKPTFLPYGLAANCLVGALILIVTTILCEHSKSAFLDSTTGGIRRRAVVIMSVIFGGLLCYLSYLGWPQSLFRGFMFSDGIWPWLFLSLHLFMAVGIAFTIAVILENIIQVFERKLRKTE